MDISGNNRYELLFMDDDSAALPIHGESVATKKKVANAASKKPASAAKKNVNVEKENKSGTLNKNDTQTKKSGAQVKPKVGSSGNAFSSNRVNDGGESRKVAFKSQNNEVREQRNNRRNVRESGPNGVEFGNDQRESRQFRDRDNRGPPRNREGGYRGGKREFDRQSGSDKTGKQDTLITESSAIYFLLYSLSYFESKV